MPNKNGTGPMGNGPMSGRGMGRCGGGRAAGPGRGMGLGRRGAFPQAPVNEAAVDEVQALKDRIAELEKKLGGTGEGK
jgi:hypothetical protein